MPRRIAIDPAKCSPSVQHALHRLREAGVRFDLKTVHQIKVDDLNFYPAKGTIFRDGDAGALDQDGLDAFIRLVRPAPRARHGDADDAFSTTEF
ncbi:hypothetical protein FV234_24780 [Methylobacterium sp. WL8]|nr:hypothetical protein FV234_24780 [Methylobacterium sp. WL8]